MLLDTKKAIFESWLIHDNYLEKRSKIRFGYKKLPTYSIFYQKVNEHLSIYLHRAVIYLAVCDFGRETLKIS